jgi:DNA-binding CsgD family transcriptional regulator
LKWEIPPYGSNSPILPVITGDKETGREKEVKKWLRKIKIPQQIPVILSIHNKKGG